MVKDEGKWICSVCKRQFAWDENSSYWGAVECAKCGLIPVEAVACSAECRKKIVVRKGKVISPVLETTSFKDEKK